MARTRTAASRPWWVAVLLVCAWAAPIAAFADEAVWKLLKGGGQVVLMRHAVTTPGVGDPEGMVLADCSTQRNLSDEGRAHARQIGEAFRARSVAVTQLYSSPWCRCLETARLAFRKDPEISPALANLFGRSDPDGRQVAQLRALASRKPASGNVVMVTHGSTVLALTGVSPATGEMVVLTPQGGGKFTVAGRLEVPGSR
ncbi:histidine phosphatase family protein [Ramlibacter sp. WS9]|uniref:histidine phosphatase family protein n=1 Tax=Ramlibacter sp. WS9 TaxID=1882741 RepID=UPI0011442FF3|nr:histidine phosphatase family protein [Ramlibacter sp. WS9]ROZ72441.1 histidine phosphatase family protein [Ramlibacter sp. WS9]